MSEENLAKLEGFCEDFKKFRDNTVNGDGNNLHDLKVTFDYVVKAINDLNIGETVFGTELENQVNSANSILSQLWQCLHNLEKAIDGFVVIQRNNNNNTY